MAFNPFKNKKKEYDEKLVETFPSEEDMLNEPLSIIENLNIPLAFEGTSIYDLEQVGLDTISLLKLASQKNVSKQQFNVPLLQNIDLKKVFLDFEATTISSNEYLIMNCNILVKENTNKWFNSTKKIGGSNAINLTKHLIALKENIIEELNDKSLFISACSRLTKIKNLQEIQKYEDNIQETSPIKKIKNEIAKVDYVNEAALKKEKYKEITDELNVIPLDTILEYIGANNNEDNQTNKWKIHDTLHNIGVTGQEWKNWNNLVGGYGGISLLADVIAERENIRVTDENKQQLWFRARKELLIEFGQDINDETYKGMTFIKDLKEPFYMPHIIPFKIDDVKEYLHKKRGIPVWILNKQIQENLLFAGAPSNWKNDVPFLHDPKKLSNENVWAVFLSVNGEAAEMRGIQRTDHQAKINAAGSIKNNGGFLLKHEKDCNEKTVTALEAAIDACSYHAFYPGRVATSCMGVNFNLAVDAALEAVLDNFWNFELAYDNDLAGNEATVRFQERMLEEIEEEDYNNLVNDGKIKFFDLAIKCLQESVLENKIFYFDVANNEIGKQAAILFQQQLSKIMPMSEIKNLIKDGKLKYANIAPKWELINDPVIEAKQIFNLLNSNQSYYLNFKEIELDKKDTEKLFSIKNAFELAFNELAKDKKEQWIKEGKIINSYEPIAKDWNEYLLYMQKKPEFVNKLIEQEKHYGLNYNTNNVKKTVKKNKIN